MSSSDETRCSPRQSAAWIDPGAEPRHARVGDSRLVRGGSKVVFAEDPQSMEKPEARGRTLSEAEIAERGLLQERVIEFGEMREEAVVSKQAVVREELVVRRDVEERTERIEDTVRRTEVDVERLEAGEGADGRGAEGAPGR